MAAESWEIAVNGVSLSNPEKRVDFFAGLPVSVLWSVCVCVCVFPTPAGRPVSIPYPTAAKGGDPFGMAATISWARTLPVSVPVSR